MTTQRLCLSRPAVAAAAAVLGLVTGYVRYLHRSAELEVQRPGTEAWIPHLVVLAVVAAWFAVAARRSPLDWKVIFAPLGCPIAARVAATFRTPIRPVSLLRRAAVALLVLLQVYMAWRIGHQVLAGLDPNFARNAWGGPSYAGAMFCHYLDGALLYAICCALLHAVTVPGTPGALRPWRLTSRAAPPRPVPVVSRRSGPAAGRCGRTRRTGPRPGRRP